MTGDGPVEPPFIPVCEPVIDESDIAAVVAVMREGFVSGDGPAVARFEETCADRFGRRYAIAVTNGSVALDLAVAALNLGPGDEVILPAFTIISVAAAVVRSGATPVLVDSQPDTWTMDPAHVAARITPRTRAIIAVHTYGLPVDMAPILSLADKHGLAVIEDAAEAHGLTYKGQPCGGFGDLSTLSFYANKMMTTGEGGMILTDSPALAETARSARNLCFQRERRFVHEQLGTNARLSSLQAALGTSQLRRLDTQVAARRRVAAVYDQAFADLSEVRRPIPETPDARNSYWVYGLLPDPAHHRDGAAHLDALTAARIGARPFFWPMHRQPVFNRMGLFRHESLPVSEMLGAQGFYIPCGGALTDNSLQRVIAAVRDLLA